MADVTLTPFYFGDATAPTGSPAALRGCRDWHEAYATLRLDGRTRAAACRCGWTVAGYAAHVEQAVTRHRDATYATKVSCNGCGLIFPYFDPHTCP